jgi:carboxypeptidase C (cathepsin A)
MLSKYCVLLKIFLSVLFLAAAFPVVVCGAEDSAAEKKGSSGSSTEKAVPCKTETPKVTDSVNDLAVESSSVTTHTVNIDGKDLTYEAEAATYVLKEEEYGKAKARIFYTAYTKKGEEKNLKRPITFAFNGGPGSSSVWLHLGALGPRKIKLDKEGFVDGPCASLMDNPWSILDLTDLVFIDPVTTGYSRAVDAEKANTFHGVEKDIASVGEFVRLYVTRKQRWLSPKFLAGESYGTTRATGLVHHMSGKHNMLFNGLILVSSVLDFQTIAFDEGNDLPYVLFLPTYTATGWHYKKLSPELMKLTLRQVVDKAREFASGEYSVALLKGTGLSKDDRKAVIGKMSAFTGLDEAYISDSSLRVSLPAYCKRILKDEHKIVGRMDSRYTGAAFDLLSKRPSYDPSLSYLCGPFSAVLNHYVRSDLGFKSDLPYELLTGRTWPWNWGAFENRYVNMVPRLKKTYADNPALKVFVANGYYDGATPFMATEYTFAHIFPEGFEKNVEMNYYEAGHMMYTKEKCLKKLKKDLSSWITKSIR